MKNIILFGSMASGEFNPKHSDVNVLVVADMSFASLEQMGPPLKAWLKKGQTPPVLVSPQDLKGFARDFPIEFLDMQDHHRVLVGDNPLTQMSVDRQHLRAQCEHDLALSLLKLRQGIAAASGNARSLRTLLEQSLPSVMTLLRSVVRLEENATKLDKIKAAEQLASRTGYEMSVIHRLHDLRFRRATDNINDLAIHYLELLETVLKHLRK